MAKFFDMVCIMKAYHRYKFLLVAFLLILSFSGYSQAKRVVGILKFNNESSAQYDWISNGIEQILYSKLKDISSISVFEEETLSRILQKLGNNSSPQIGARQAFSIGKETGIEVLILGNYRVVNDNLAIGFKLVSTYTGSPVMEQAFSGQLADIFALFESALGQAMDIMQIPLSDSDMRILNDRPTSSILAFEDYCKAYAEIGKGSTMEIIAGYFQRAVRSDPDFWEAQYNLGVIYYNFDLYKKALEQFDTVIRHNPDFYKPIYGRGVIYFLQKEYKRSLNEFKKVLRLNKDHDRSYYYLGIVYTELDSLKKASQYLDKSIELNPNYAPAFYQLSITERNRGWFKKAINSAKTALKLNPGFYQANNSLGECYYALNLFEEAIIEFNKAIKLRPSYSTAYFNLGNAIYKKGALEEIVDAYWSILENQYIGSASSSNANSPVDDLRDLREKSRSRDVTAITSQMVSAYRNALTYDRNFYEASYNLALTYENAGNLDSAEYFYKQTISIKPELAQAHMKLARLYDVQTKYDMALGEYKEVVKNDPEYFSGNPRLGESYRYINIVETVLQEYQSRLARNPRDKDALKVVGKIHLSLGRLGQAENYYQQLVQLSPNDNGAAETLREIRRKMRKL